MEGTIAVFGVVVTLLAAVASRATRLKLPIEVQVVAGGLLLFLLGVGVFVKSSCWLLAGELVAGVLVTIVLCPTNDAS